MNKGLLNGMVAESRGRGRLKTDKSFNIKEICGLTMVGDEKLGQYQDQWASCCIEP